MKECDECIYTDIADWLDIEMQSIPILWCERKEEFCNNISDCNYFDDGKE